MNRASHVREKSRNNSRNVSIGSNANSASSIPQLRRCSSSIDITNRGSYLPPNARRSNSMDRNRSFGKPTCRSTPKKASFGNSTKGSLPRGSSVTKKCPIKDTRPLSDRAYQKQCINLLVDYLDENNFQYTVSRQGLLRPMKRDVETIFQFLYNMWDPKYEAKAIEDEMPKLLKSLNYPFIINRSGLLSITNMSWPSILGAIMWLLDLNKSCGTIKIDNYLMSTDEEFDAHQSVLLNYIFSSYETGSDPEQDKAVFAELIRKKHGNSVDIDVIKNENQVLEELIQGEIEDQDAYNQLVEDIERLEGDINNYQIYIEQMNEHIKNKTEVYEDIKSKNTKKEQELKELKTKMSQLEEVYKTQGFDGEQALNFHQSQKEILTRNLDQKKDEVKQEEKEYWDLEIEYAKLSDKAQTRCVEFSRKWEQLANMLDNLLNEVLKNSQVPTAKKLCRDYNFNLPELNVHPKFTEDIKPLLLSAKNYIEDQTKQIKNIVSFQEHHIQQIGLKTSDKRMQTDLLAAQWKQKEREIDLKMEKNMKSLEDLKQNSQTLEKQTANIHRNNKTLQENIDTLKKSKEEIYKRVKTKEAELQLLKIEGQRTIQNIQIMINESVKRTQDKLQNAMKLMDEHMQFVKENPLPHQ